MAKPKKISEKEYIRKWDSLLHRASRLTKKFVGVQDSSYFFSASFDSCSGGINESKKLQVNVNKIRHFTKISCNDYCQDNLPMASCLCTTGEGYAFTYWFTIHRVGNCPWKVEKEEIV